MLCKSNINSGPSDYLWTRMFASKLQASFLFSTITKMAPLSTITHAGCKGTLMYWQEKLGNTTSDCSTQKVVVAPYN